MLFGAYRFLSEVAVENLLHQRSVSATAVQHTREEKRRRKKPRTGEKEKQWKNRAKTETKHQKKTGEKE